MKQKNIFLNKYILSIPIILLITVVLELFVFNFRHFESIRYKEKSIFNENYIINTKKGSIEFENVNEEINNIYLNFSSTTDEVITINLESTDEANKKYFSLPEKEINNNYEQMKYIKINLSGKTNKIKLNYTGDNTQIKDIKINSPKPLFISTIRIILIFISIYCLFLIRPKSELYKHKLLNNKYSKYFILAYIIIQSLFFITLVNMNYLQNLFQIKELI